MKKLIALLLVALAATSLAAAGEVYGKIVADGNPVGEGTTVSAKCASKSYPAVPTDKAGSYHIVLDETGKCALTVTHKGQSAEVGIVSYDDAVQVDLVLEVRDGKLTARRK
jgi:hypothetical protein